MTGVNPIDPGPGHLPDDPDPSPGGRAKPISVLHLYSGNLYGGIEAMLATLARCSNLEPKLRMEYALCFPGRIRDELMATGAVVHDLGSVKFRHPWTIFRARHRLNQILKQRRIDVVIVHALWPCAVFATVLVRMSPALVFWQHDFVGSGHWIERLSRRVRPDQIISNSRASASTLPQLFPDIPFQVVNCPVSNHKCPTDATNQRSELRRRLDTPDDSVIIILASRMEPLKGHTTLIKALTHLRDQPNWMVWMIGGAQRPHEQAHLAQLEALIAEAGITDRIRFLGQRTDVPQLLRAADIHCQPNQGPESFGIAFIEALYAGLPVVSTRIGGAVEIIDETCGVLVEPNDVPALASVLRRLIDDPSARARLAQGGPARASSLCDPRRTLRELSRVLARTVSAEENG